MVSICCFINNVVYILLIFSWTTVIWLVVWKNTGYTQSFKKCHRFCSQGDSSSTGNYWMYNRLQHHCSHPLLHDCHRQRLLSRLPCWTLHTNISHCWRYILLFQLYWLSTIAFTFQDPSLHLNISSECWVESDERRQEVTRIHNQLTRFSPW